MPAITSNRVNIPIRTMPFKRKDVFEELEEGLVYVICLASGSA